MTIEFIFDPQPSSNSLCYGLNIDKYTENFENCLQFFTHTGHRNQRLPGLQGSNQGKRPY